MPVAAGALRMMFTIWPKERHTIVLSMCIGGVVGYPACVFEACARACIARWHKRAPSASAPGGALCSLLL